ncbi:hypothetical protein NP493_340g03079 [Ridgeia piscesae]|uniref:SH3 domain-containing protein n=1 Tax=Ridgeia piscesae TaxID=27915 RepID=A0AAD9L588_RIDPI|nr:hypothetical protein NP493_340g03079 [Ridgeia piscesae]
MYRALYAFKSDNPNALGFDAGERFTVIDDKKDSHWWLVQNDRDEVGYVPANYVKRDETPHGEVLLSIDRAVSAIHNMAARKGGVLTQQQTQNLHQLEQHRRSVLKHQQQERLPEKRRSAPVPPGGSDTHQSRSDSLSNEVTTPRMKSREAPPVPCASPSTGRDMGGEHCNSEPATGEISHNKWEPGQESAPTKTPPPNPPSDHPSCAVSHAVAMDTVPPNIAMKMVEEVRRNTQLSYELSHTAVATVLNQLKDNVPCLSQVMTNILHTLIQHKANHETFEGSQDAQKLEMIFRELSACKDDSQQRSWFLHEDEHTITTHLNELLSILSNADPQLCRHVIDRDNYEAVHNLVLYYQMETRVSLRLLLLKVFGALCGLGPTFISELLTSVLPLELARDIQTDMTDLKKLCFSSLVLTMLLSMGEALPVHHYTHLNVDFVKHLLQHIETAGDVGEEIGDIFLNIIFAFNLHFELPKENLVMQALAEVGDVKVFTEKLMLLFNRGADPVRLFEHEPKPPNSVLKLTSDLYSSASTADLLYTNDAKVLIDIVVRQITDLSPGDMMRTEYLSLMLLILQNSSYLEHLHRQEDLHQCFTKIYHEEGRDSDPDRSIVTHVYAQFPQYFHK